MSIAIVVHRSHDRVLLKCDYDESFINMLKRLVRPHNRKWDPQMKVWVLTERGLEIIRNSLHSHYRTVIEACDLDVMRDTLDQERRNQRYAPRDGNWAVLHLEPGAPKQVVNAAYRALASLNHPDHGGSNDAMAKINGAYRKVLESFGT